MLVKADDKLVPQFLQALSETHQQHVVDILVGKGLNTFVVLRFVDGPLCFALSSFFVS